ncbi:MAG: hypothetical protein GXP48_02745 [Acidobacteria bacterium]|nr:hypothetical protein [Acidobacteriota bacterium]
MKRACRRWSLMPPGAAVALGISGGTDSYALAWLASRYNRIVRPRCRFIGIHVALDASGRTEGLPAAVTGWCESLGVPVDTVEPRFDPGKTVPGGCFTCAHVRRRTLLEAANERGCDRVALGHHADDVVETWLMSLMYTGTPDVLPPVRSYFGGVITLVRPLYELRKAELVRMARLCGFPPPVQRCPEHSDTKRDLVRAALRQLGRDERDVRRHLFWAAVRSFERDRVVTDT